MSSKFTPERSPPHHGIGFFKNISRDFSLNFLIQSGSPLRCEISSTTSLDSPFFDLKTYFSGVLKPYLYSSPIPVISFVISTSVYCLMLIIYFFFQPVVTFIFQLLCKLRTARLHNPSINKDMDKSGLHIVEYPCIMGYHYNPNTFFNSPVYTFGYNFHGIYIKP